MNILPNFGTERPEGLFGKFRLFFTFIPHIYIRNVCGKLFSLAHILIFYKDHNTTTNKKRE